MQDGEYREWTERASGRDIARRERLKRRRFYVRIVEWAVLAIVVLGVAFVATALYTDRPGFCGTCHEMQPYYHAWASGPHAKVSCVRCHVAPGVISDFAHKFVALGEVRSHITGDTKFPRKTPPDVPDSRCVPCHKNIPDKPATGFLHSQHEPRGTCVQCHSRTGHDVSEADLTAAGIFSGSKAATEVAGRVAVVDGGVANLPGHKPVDCSRCHNLAKTGCQRCHKPNHVARGTCSKCHQPGATWVFSHPMSGVDCSICHKAPAKHVNRTDCASCHPDAGVSWKRAHVAGQDCAPCHAKPAKHRDGACPDCHKKPGVSWTFSHPDARANCVDCHPKPAGHKPGACNSCHKKPGKSWAFSHPSGPGCASCHSAPANHANQFVGSCNNCHKQPGKSWAFSHARVQHGYRSRPCVKCHPDNYTTHRCTCHGNRQ